MNAYRELTPLENLETIESQGRIIDDLKFKIGRIDLIAKSETGPLSEFQKYRILEITEQFTLNKLPVTW